MVSDLTLHFGIDDVPKDHSVDVRETAWSDSLRLIYKTGGLVLRFCVRKCRIESVQNYSVIRVLLSCRV